MAYPGGVLGCSSTLLSRRVAEEVGAHDCRASVTVNGLVNVQARLIRFSMVYLAWQSVASWNAAEQSYAITTGREVVIPVRMRTMESPTK